MADGDLARLCRRRLDEGPGTDSAGETQIYSTPDRITGSFELRRITTRYWRGERRRRVDFFEFYWAHMMQGNTLGAVIGWLQGLLFAPLARAASVCSWAGRRACCCPSCVGVSY